jgi:hypothetical protein
VISGRESLRLVHEHKLHSVIDKERRVYYLTWKSAAGQWGPTSLIWQPSMFFLSFAVGPTTWPYWQWQGSLQGASKNKNKKTFHFRKEWVALLFETSNMPKMLHVSLAT